MLEYAKTLAQTDSVQSSLAPAIAHFLLYLEEYTQNYGETLNDMCLELCEKVGTIDGVSDNFKVSKYSFHIFLAPEANFYRCINVDRTNSK